MAERSQTEEQAAVDRALQAQYEAYVDGLREADQLTETARRWLGNKENAEAARWLAAAEFQFGRQIGRAEAMSAVINATATGAGVGALAYRGGFDRRGEDPVFDRMAQVRRGLKDVGWLA